MTEPDLTPPLDARERRELDSRVAIVCFQWSWWAGRGYEWHGERHNAVMVWEPWRRFIAPPGYEAPVGDFYRPSDGTEDLYRDWDTFEKLPHYSGWTGLPVVLAWLRAKGFRWESHESWLVEGNVVFRLRVPPCAWHLEAVGDDLPTAAAKAALKAGEAML